MIVALCNHNGIGKNNQLPWHFKKDLKYFSKLTRGNGNNAIVMGKNTWNSLPLKPLPKRENIILSTSIQKQPTSGEKYIFFKDINLLKKYCQSKNFDEIWIIGGSSIYEQFLDDPQLKKIFITKIEKDYDCDAFFPTIPNSFHCATTETVTENNVAIKFLTYERIKDHTGDCL